MFSPQLRLKRKVFSFRLNVAVAGCRFKSVGNESQMRGAATENAPMPATMGFSQTKTRLYKVCVTAVAQSRFVSCTNYLRNRRWGGCVYVLQMFSFVFFAFSVRHKNARQPFSGTAERIIMKLLPDDSGENGVCIAVPKWGIGPQLIFGGLKTTHCALGGNAWRVTQN